MSTEKFLPIKTILVPTDFSECAYNALQYAASMAKTVEASLLVYHTFFHAITRTGTAFIKTKDSLLAERQTKMKELHEKMTADPVFEGLKCEFVVDEKETMEGINSIASGNSIDLIVMGTKGASGLLGKYLGSFTSAVISSSILPVLAIPMRSSWKKPERIVLALDRSEHYQKSDFTILVQLAKHYSANVTVVDVVEEEKAQVWDTDDISDWLPRIAFTEHTIRGKDVDKQVNDYAERETVNWVAVVPLSSSFFDYLLNKNVTKEFALNTKMPLLALK